MTTNNRRRRSVFDGQGLAFGGPVRELDGRGPGVGGRDPIVARSVGPVLGPGEVVGSRCEGMTMLVEKYGPFSYRISS
jgi:hypothetical protein